jgi:hypothetical protein
MFRLCPWFCFTAACSLGSLMSSAQDFLLPPEVFVFPAGEFPSRQGRTPVSAAGEKSRSSGGRPVSFPRWSLSRSAKSFSSSARSASWFPIFAALAARSASPGFDSRRRRCAPVSARAGSRFHSSLCVWSFCPRRSAGSSRPSIPFLLFAKAEALVFRLSARYRCSVSFVALLILVRAPKRSSAWFPLRPRPRQERALRFFTCRARTAERAGQFVFATSVSKLRLCLPSRFTRELFCWP